MTAFLKKAIIAVGLLLCGTTLSIGIVEFGLRAFFPQPLYAFEKGLFVPSVKSGYTLAPRVEKKHSQPEYSYTIKSNSHGFGGKEPNFNASYRVMVLGDSFGMGQGVPEGKNLCDLAQAEFDRRGLDIDIFNTSVSGYSGINQLAILRGYIASYKPNLVLLLFHPNDIGAKESLKVEDGYLVLRTDDRIDFRIREWLNNHSHIYCLVKNVYYSRFKENPIDNRGYRYLSKEIVEQAVDSIEKFQMTCFSNHSIFHVILLPYGKSTNEQKKDSSNPIAHKLLEKSINVHDWSNKPISENYGDIAYKFDGHWNEKGHKYFSKFLSEIILENMNISI